MTYIGEIRAFYDALRTEPLSSGQIALWHALMDICNRCYWKEWFNAPMKLLEEMTGMQRTGVQKARKALQERGLLEFRQRGTKSTEYKLISLQGASQGASEGASEGASQGASQGASEGASEGAILIDIDKHKDKYVVLDSAEPKNDFAPNIRPMILNDASEYRVLAEDLKTWKELYPAVDVERELAKMAGWLDANPKNRKTRNGIKRFINAWLAREQDKPSRSQQNQNKTEIPPPRALDPPKRYEEFIAPDGMTYVREVR